MSSQTYARATGNEPSSDSNEKQKSDQLNVGASSNSTKTPRRVRATASRMNNNSKSASAFRTISEVADELDVQQHVLRFWETKFSQIRPLKRGGGRRYYRPEDMALLKRIHHLLYTEGYTIKGVQKLLRDMGKRAFVDAQSGSNIATANISENIETGDAASITQDQAPESIVEVKQGLSQSQREALKIMLGELKELRRIVADGEAA